MAAAHKKLIDNAAVKGEAKNNNPSINNNNPLTKYNHQYLWVETIFNAENKFAIPLYTKIKAKKKGSTASLKDKFPTSD